MKWKFSLLLLAFYKVATQKVEPNLSLFGEKKNKVIIMQSFSTELFQVGSFSPFPLLEEKFVHMLYACIFIPANIQRPSENRINLRRTEASNRVTKIQVSVPVSLWVSQWLKICAASCSAECYDVTIHQGGNP